MLPMLLGGGLVLTALVVLARSEALQPGDEEQPDAATDASPPMSVACPGGTARSALLSETRGRGHPLLHLDDAPPSRRSPGFSPLQENHRAPRPSPTDAQLVGKNTTGVGAALPVLKNFRDAFSERR
jgi:hypothetical protein